MMTHGCQFRRSTSPGEYDSLYCSVQYRYASIQAWATQTAFWNVFLVKEHSRETRLKRIPTISENLKLAKNLRKESVQNDYQSRRISLPKDHPRHASLMGRTTKKNIGGRVVVGKREPNRFLSFFGSRF